MIFNCAPWAGRRSVIKTHLNWRRVRNFLFLAMNSFWILACSLKLGEEAPPQKPFVYPETCLTESYDKLALLIDAKAEERDIHFAMDCMGQILGRLRDKVRGEQKESFKDTEIAEFIEKNFFEEGSKKKISFEFLHQGMLVKRLLVGGDDKIITRDEITKAIAFVQRFKGSLIEVNPFLQVFLQKWKPQYVAGGWRDLDHYEQDLEYFDRSSAALQKFVDYLASEFETNHQDYDLANVPRLVHELDLFDGVDNGYGSTFEKYIPLVMKLKKALSGGTENIVQSAEWRNFGVLGSRGYVQYLRYHYFIDAAPESGLASQLPYIAKAAEEVFDTMSYLVAQKENQTMSRQEILDIFQAFASIFPSIKMSDKLLFEMMKIKQVLLGGQLEFLTNRDFLVAKSRVPVFRNIAEKISPYFRIYTHDWDAQHGAPSELKRNFSEAFTQLMQSGMLLKSNLVASYDLNDLSQLLEELNRLYPPSEISKNQKTVERGSVETVKEYLPLFVHFKEIVSDSQGSRIEVGHWGRLLEYSIKALQSYLYYEYFVTSEKDELRQWDEYGQLVQISSNFLQELAISKSKKQILNSELIAFLESMKKMELIIPKELSTQTISEVLNVLVNRVFISPEERFQKAVSWEGFSVSHFQQIQKDLHGLFYILKFSDATTAHGSVVYSQFVEVLAREIQREDLLPEEFQVLRELKLLMAGPVPSQIDPEGRMYITSEEKMISRTGLRWLIAARTIASYAIRSFAEQLDRAHVLVGAINIDEAQNLFKVLGPVLKDLKLIEKIDEAFVKSRFFEANTFTPRAFFDVWVSYPEMGELVVHLLSGIQISSQIVDGFRKFEDPQGSKEKCRIETTDDPISLNCYRRVTKTLYATIFPQMPKLEMAAEKMSEGEWKVFIEAAILAAGYEGGKLKEVVKLSEMSLVPHFIQYLEMLYAKFDVNRNSLISTDESKLAYPTFEVVLKEAAREYIDSGDLKETEVYDLFTYILKNSKKPMSALEKINFKFGWIGKTEKWNLAVDRKSIGVTLKYISENISKNAVSIGRENKKSTR